MGRREGGDTHTHTHTHTYTHTHIHTHTYIYTHIYTHIHIHTHTHIQVNTYLHTHIQIHTYTHTHHNLQTSVVCEALARAPSGTCSFWGRKKRETRVTLGLFLPPLRSDTGDTTHVSLATMRHRGVEIQLFDEYYCLSTSFSGTPESSAVSFFSPWRSF